jgi:aspartyl protease family protein
LMMEGGQVACLAMKPGNRTVIGAFQQVDTRFVYDVEDSKLSFAPELCTLDTVQAD